MILNLWMNFMLQVLLECSGEQNHGQALRKLLSTLTERGIKETSVLLLLKEVEDSSTNTAGILLKCDRVGKLLHTRTDSFLLDPLQHLYYVWLLSDKRTDDCIGVSLLRTFQNRLGALNLEAWLIRRSLEEGPSISSDQREV